MKKLLLLFTCAVFTACSAKLLVPTQADAERGSDRYAGLTLAELKTGKATYERFCDKCHPLKKTEKFTVSEWESIVPDMVRKVNKKESLMTEKDENDVLKYVTTMAKRS